MVSVIIATYNRKDRLRRTLVSVNAQDYQPLQIIVIDNASCDGTCEMLATEFPAVTVIRAESNRGPGAARNLGIAIAKGEFSFTTDDDVEILTSDAISRAVSLLDSKPELGAVAFRVLNGEGQVARESIPRQDKKSDVGDFTCSYFCGSGAIFRTTVLKNAGLFWEELFMLGEELDLSYRILDLGYSIYFMNDIVVQNQKFTKERDPGRALYFLMRNRPLIAARHLPWRHVLSTIIIWSLYSGVKSVRQRCWSAWARALIDSARMLPMALQLRRRLSPASLSYLRHHQGRLWF